MNIIDKTFNNKKLIDILFVISTVALIAFIIYILVKDLNFTAFNPINIIWYVILILKLRSDYLHRGRNKQDSMFK